MLLAPRLLAASLATAAAVPMVFSLRLEVVCTILSRSIIYFSVSLCVTNVWRPVCGPVAGNLRFRSISPAAQSQVSTQPLPPRSFAPSRLLLLLELIQGARHEKLMQKRKTPLTQLAGRGKKFRRTGDYQMLFSLLCLASPYTNRCAA